MCSPSWTPRDDWSSKSKSLRNTWLKQVLTDSSEKEDIDLQLRAVPDIEQRIAELEAAM